MSRLARLVVLVLAILPATVGLVANTSPGVAQAATCISSVGPGIPPPAAVPSGIPGFHAAWYGQSGYPTLCPGDRSTATVAYYNSGSLGWVKGRMGEVAYLGTWGPEPGQDLASPLGGEAIGWPRYNRIAMQPADYVGPGQVAWFQFVVQAPTKPGFYKLYLRPLIEGATWLEDYGVFWQFWVLNPDGTYPPPPAQVGCREWPGGLGTMLAKLPIEPGLCLLPYAGDPLGCFSNGGCYSWSRPAKIWVRQQTDFASETIATAHETCHSHQDLVLNGSGWPLLSVKSWESTQEGLEFASAWREYWAHSFHGFGDTGIIYENFAWVCAGWYYPFGNYDTAKLAPLANFAAKWLPR